MPTHLATLGRTVRLAAAAAAAVTGLSGVSPAHAQIDIESHVTYDLSLDEAPVAMAELQIKTCASSISSDAGTGSDAYLTIEGWGKDSAKHYYLDLPYNDSEPGMSDYYSFKFPKSKIGELKSFRITIEGDDAWCISNVALFANGSRIMAYRYNDPLAGDHMNVFSGWTGKGVLWLSSDPDEGNPSVTFSDTFARIPIGTTEYKGYMALPLRRSEDWKWFEDNNLQPDHEAGWPANACTLPRSISLSDLKTLVSTKLGDMMARKSNLYWGGDGYVAMSVTKRGSAPVFHAHTKFRAEAPFDDAYVWADVDITPKCDGTKGLVFEVSEPDVDVSLSTGSKFVRGLTDALTLGFAELFIDWDGSVPNVASTTSKVPMCPTFSVNSRDDLVMTWPTTVPYSSLDLPKGVTFKPAPKPTDRVLLPQNSMCIDMSSIAVKR